MRVRQTLTINRPPEEVYRFWHDFENLPRFMRHLEHVDVLEEGRSRWRTRGPGSTPVEWEAEITEDRPNALIAWRACHGATVQHAGTVRFAPASGDRGTEVSLDMQVRLPGHGLGASVARMFRKAPDQQTADDLRAFKQVMETGEVLQSAASIHSGTHPARPPQQPTAP